MLCYYYFYAVETSQTVKGGIDLKKSIVLALILMLMILEWPAYNIFRYNDITAQAEKAGADTSGAAELLKTWEKCSVEDAQHTIDLTDEEYLKQQTENNIKKEIEDTIKQIEKGKLTYRELFSDVYVCGDSLVAGLSAFGLINGNHLMARVSANLKDLRENLPRIKRAKPKILILHYGINHISSKKEKGQQFADNYRRLIRQIKESCPKTRIIISLLFPVDTNIAKDPKFKGVNNFNKCMKKMCEEEGIEYLDNSSLAEQCSEYTKGDGIHMEREFYTKFWGKHIIRELRIYK